MKISSRVIILRDNRFLALVKRVRGDRTYYIFPGATVEENEDPKVAAARGVKYYFGVNIKLREHVAELIYKSERHIYYMADYVSGEFGSGQATRRDPKKVEKMGQTFTAWIPMREINTVQVFPIVITDLVKKIHEKGVPGTVSKFEDIENFLESEFE